MPCSVFENDETVKGCKAGSSVEYCEPCFREVIEEDEKVECKVQLGSANEWMKRLNRASPAAGHPTYHDVNVIKLK